MSGENLIRWGGPAAVLGGMLWIVPAIVTASKPRGCIGPEECGVTTMRDTSDVAIFLLLALLLSAAGLAGVAIRARSTGRFRGPARAGVALYGVGVALFVLGTALTAISEVFWLLMLPAGLALIGGMVLVGVGALKTGLLPRWAAVTLVVGSLAMLGFNDQNAQVLMAIPFGISWIAVGYALRSDGGSPVRRTAPVR